MENSGKVQRGEPFEFKFYLLFNIKEKILKLEHHEEVYKWSL